MNVRWLVVAAILLALFANLASWRSTYINCSRINHSHGYIQAILQRQVDNLESGKSDLLYQRLYGPNWENMKNMQIAQMKKDIHSFDPVRCIVPWSQT